MDNNEKLASREARMTMRGRGQQFLAMLLAVLAVALGVMVTSSATANAATTQCGNGRCVVYLNKGETAAMGKGRAPALPTATPWQIKTSYTALVQGHRWFAQQYANRGWCSVFRLSIRPWESQGYAGYRC